MTRSTLLPLSLLALLLGGCTTLGYYAQAVRGHLELLYSSRPIEELLADPQTPVQLKDRLRRVLEIRSFASRELALPDNASYRSYAELQREVAVWSVVAAPEFSMEPVQWCYPVVGCAVYRGYFDRADAAAEAARLAARGRDVAVEPVAAYSTLGWLDDPLPGTVLDWPEPLLAGLVFHELAHQQLYVADDSSFNESFASAVEQAGVERWLAAGGDDRLRREWARRLERERSFVRLLLETRERLQALYARSLPSARLRRLKQAEFDRLREQYAGLKRSWGGDTGLDHWFDRPLNNARLALVGTYEIWVPAFLALLEHNGGDFSAFYRAAGHLAALPADERRQRLDELGRQATRRNAG